MRNVSDKSCRGNQNTFYVQEVFFPPKIVPFIVVGVVRSAGFKVIWKS